MVSAGEASGDMHAANALAALHMQDLHCEFFGMGGPALENLGTDILVDCRDLAVVGIVEVLVQYRRIMRQLEKLRTALRQRRPDLLLLVDFPEFNLKLAETAKQLGIRVVFYISPQVWAWRAHRVKRIAALVDMMAVLFRFEVDFYRDAGIPVKFVGHPLLDEIPADLNFANARDKLGFNHEQRLCGLLPGSRHGEIKRLLPLLLDCAQTLHDRFPELQFVLPVAPTLKRQELEQVVASVPFKVHFFDQQRHPAIAACNVAICASGTATLELGLLGVPMVIAYRVNPLTYAIMRRLITIEHVGLVNIVSDSAVAKEFIQNQAQCSPISLEAIRLLENQTYRVGIQSKLKQLRAQLGNSGASKNMAALIAEQLRASGD